MPTPWPAINSAIRRAGTFAIPGAVAGALVLAGGSSTAIAHPHVFIDTGLSLVFDGAGQLAALRVVWVYDDFYSLVTVEDRGLDPDGDGVLTADETAQLSGFDMNWDAGFDGDTYALQGGKPLALSGPSDWTADYRDGRVITSHLRRLEAPADPSAGPVAVQIYDPSYYTAYQISAAPKIEGRADCVATVFQPDAAAADATLRAALDEQLGTAGLDADFPAVGAAFAEEVRLTCGG